MSSCFPQRKIIPHQLQITFYMSYLFEKTPQRSLNFKTSWHGSYKILSKKPSSFEQHITTFYIEKCSKQPFVMVRISAAVKLRCLDKCHVFEGCRAYWRTALVLLFSCTALIVVNTVGLMTVHCCRKL